MDCRTIEFSPIRAQQRIDKVLRVFPKALVFRIIAFCLYLLGAKLNQISALVGMPEESIRTYARVVFRDGFDALLDRRRNATPVVFPTVQASASTRVEDDWLIVKFDSISGEIKIPIEHKVQARTVLLTLVQSKLLANQDIASALALSPGTCHQLAKKLLVNDVELALFDKRRGQTRDYRVGTIQKAEIIKHYAARAVSGHCTSSDKVAEAVNADSEIQISARTLRWHVAKLGLPLIKRSLPEMVDTLKKTPDPAS